MHTAPESGRHVLLAEAACLDEKRWDDWLALYCTDCTYWLPTWLTEETLSADPQRELAHIYYTSRAGLEDRVRRIRSRQSPASNAMRRTTHMVGNILALQDEGSLQKLRSSWTCHVFDPLRKTTSVLFGHAEFVLRLERDIWRIAAQIPRAILTRSSRASRKPSTRWKFLFQNKAHQ